MIDRLSPVPLYAQLREKLKEKIRRGEWKVGEQIPTEMELVKEYQVSRATVRTALDSLVLEGYILKRHGVGTFVVQLRPMLGFEPLISLNYALEVGGIESHNIVVASEKIKPNWQLKAIMRWKEQINCFHVRRLRLVENIPIALEDSYFHPAVERYLESRDLTGSIAKILLNEAHMVISKVEQVIVPRESDDEERRFLRLGEELLVLDLQRWIYAQGFTEPLYYLKFVMRADIVNFQRLNRSTR